MASGGFRFGIEVRSDGALVQRTPASIAPCVEDALFQGVLRGRFPNDGRLPQFRIEPQWRDREPPLATGLTLLHPDAAPIEYATQVFAPQARRAIRSVREAKVVDEGAPLEWNLVAEERADEPAGAVRVTRAPFPLLRCELPACAEGSLGVEVESEVLDTIRRVTCAARATERAGILLGTVLHDPLRRAARLCLRAEVALEAGPGGASQAHFDIAPSSLLAAQRAVRQRSDGLVAAGWWHSHPPCDACFEQPGCAADVVFLSASDEEVHTTAFPRAFAVALVAGKVARLPATRPGFRLFGWQRARLVRRPFEVGGAGATAYRSEDPTPILEVA